jgi:pimeloyl-ACP methyl ester carboxylesterase
MYYETYGSGEPLLLLHGNSVSIKSFKYQIPALAKKYKVIALDSRGQGKSSEDGTKFTYELFAADTRAFLDQLQLDSLNIVGWSDGGNIGLIMAMKYPGKVKSLVTMGANLYNNKSSVRADVNKFIKKEYAKLSDTCRADIFRKRMYDLLLYEPNIEAKELAAIHCPVLVLAGSDDLIKEEHTKLIAASIKNAQLYIFPNGTHDEPSERPARFNKEVMDFLNANKR